MLKTLMISAAISALMVSGVLAQADMSKPTGGENRCRPARHREIHRGAEPGPVGFLQVQRHRCHRPGQRPGRQRQRHAVR